MQPSALLDEEAPTLALIPRPHSPRKAALTAQARPVQTCPSELYLLSRFGDYMSWAFLAASA